MVTDIFLSRCIDLKTKTLVRVKMIFLVNYDALLSQKDSCPLHLMAELSGCFHISILNAGKTDKNP